MDRDEAAGEEQSPDVQAGGLREERKVLRGEGPLPNHLILDLCDPGKGIPFRVWTGARPPAAPVRISKPHTLGLLAAAPQGSSGRSG